MADNVVITSGANSTPPDGTSIATDDVAGVQFQRVKLDLGADGASTPVVGSLPVSGTVAVSGSVTTTGTVTANAGTNLNTSALALDATLAAEGVLIGAVTEGAPASDTASSGLNGRLQRIAQRLTSLIALLPTSLGQKASAASLAVVVASDQSAIPVSGTLTAITNVVHVDDNAGSLTVDNAGTFAVQSTVQNAAGAAAVNIQDGGNSITVDGAVTVSGTATVSGTVAATQSGTWTVTESSNSADGATTIPSTDLISGWDGINVRSVFVQNLDGHNTVFTHDNLNRRLLEDVLIELRILNIQTARMLGPQALTQEDMQPLRLIN